MQGVVILPGEMAGHGRNLMEVVYYCKRYVTMVAGPFLLAMTDVSGGDCQ